ncbi:ExeA family protein [Thiomicrorhabdus arctica]|uniref:ExeA family protein n=1 Tax=Thiomicrorhabdus arctica TaxID=131540 RepID=UPI0003813810|nr:AAA family ATPase [Thiomicrorhabdus arctica]
MKFCFYLMPTNLIYFKIFCVEWILFAGKIMYRKYFGLTNLPFKTTPDISVFYKHGSRQEILEALVYTVTRGEGIVKVTGEVGCGKTMLLRLLAHSLPECFSIVYINSPNLSAKDMILYICSELEIDVDSSMLKFTVLTALKNELVRLHSLGKHVVMLIDEAQSMTIDVLEEIRLLSNLETDDDKLIQIVLFGQPELDVALRNDHIRQLKSRISFSIYIPPLTPSEVQTYLNYRVRKCSYKGLDLFDGKVSKQVHRLSLGLPRTINIIADKLLMSAYGCGDSQISRKHIRLLPASSDNASQKWMNSKYVALMFISLLLLSILLVYSFYNSIKMEDSLSQFISAYDTNLDAKKGTLSVENSTTLKGVHPVTQRMLQDSQDFGRESSPHSDTAVVGNAAVIDRKPFIKYQVKDENALVNNPVLLEKLLSLHAQSLQWINQLPEASYVVQLSTSNLRDLKAVTAYYKQYAIPIASLHLLIDFKPNASKFKLKAFYVSSQNYSELVKVIRELPPKLTLSKPYITTVKQLAQNFELTSNKLNQHGIYNDGK